MMRKRGEAFVIGERVKSLDEAKIVDLRKGGLTHKALATRFRISVTRVGDILKRHDMNGRQGDKEP